VTSLAAKALRETRQQLNPDRYTATMRFEWDEQKNKTNIRKHGLDSVDARAWIVAG